MIELGMILTVALMFLGLLWLLPVAVMLPALRRRLAPLADRGVVTRWAWAAALLAAYALMVQLPSHFMHGAFSWRRHYDDALVALFIFGPFTSLTAAWLGAGLGWLYGRLPFVRDGRFEASATRIAF